MSSLMEKAGEKIHTRDINIATYIAGEDHVIVEGALIDNRLREFYLLTGEKRPPCVLHHLIIRLLLQGRKLEIKEIEVEMPGVPREECLELKDSLNPILGLSISSGFTARVVSIMGGTRGCFHLRTLLLSMAQAAVQGYMTARMLKKVDAGSIPQSERLKYLPVDTCRVWRKDGPLIQRIIKAVDEKK